jgi:hypothetical protein
VSIATFAHPSYDGHMETKPADPTATEPATKPKRGILYVKWGTNDTVLERSIRSVKNIHPEMPIYVHQLTGNATLLDKAGMFEVTPFEETLFLDVDTVVLDRLDFGFDMAIRHGLACSICECPWARRYGGIKGDLVEYNTGVLFFTKAAKPIFDGWKKHVRSVDSSIRFYNSQNQLAVMPYNDQAGFSLAVAEAAVPPFILPFNWNFRPAWHRAWWGPIKIWHDYNPPPQDIINFTQEQVRPESIIKFVRFT